MHPLAAGRFAKAHEANRFEPFANFARALDYSLKLNLGRGIKIEHEAAGHFGIAGPAIPRMQLQPGQLRNCRETFDAIDLKIGLVAAGDFSQREYARRSRHRMALKKMLAADAVGRPDNRARPALQMRDHPWSADSVVAREIQL